ncbi:MAG: hypothetical protein KIT27_06030 [Legionellales bacterium]|nr:hypothetical protein [Legionellales bacterium]
MNLEEFYQSLNNYHKAFIFYLLNIKENFAYDEEILPEQENQLIRWFKYFEIKISLMILEGIIDAFTEKGDTPPIQYLNLMKKFLEEVSNLIPQEEIARTTFDHYLLLITAFIHLLNVDPSNKDYYLAKIATLIHQNIPNDYHIEYRLAPSLLSIKNPSHRNELSQAINHHKTFLKMSYDLNNPNYFECLIKHIHEITQLSTLTWIQPLLESSNHSIEIDEEQITELLKILISKNDSETHLIIQHILFLIIQKNIANSTDKKESFKKLLTDYFSSFVKTYKEKLSETNWNQLPNSMIVLFDITFKLLNLISPNISINDFNTIMSTIDIELFCIENQVPDIKLSYYLLRITCDKSFELPSLNKTDGMIHEPNDIIFSSKFLGKQFINLNKSLIKTLNSLAPESIPSSIFSLILLRSNPKEIIEFYYQCGKINQQVEDYQKIDVDYFFIENYRKICFIMDLLGDENAIYCLNKKLKDNLLSLNIYLSHLPVFQDSLTPSLKATIQNILNNLNGDELLNDILHIFSLLHLYLKNIDYDQESLLKNLVSLADVPNKNQFTDMLMEEIIIRHMGMSTIDNDTNDRIKIIQFYNECYMINQETEPHNRTNFIIFFENSLWKILFISKLLTIKHGVKDIQKAISLLSNERGTHSLLPLERYFKHIRFTIYFLNNSLDTVLKNIMAKIMESTDHNKILSEFLSLYRLLLLYTSSAGYPPSSIILKTYLLELAENSSSLKHFSQNLMRDIITILLPEENLTDVQITQIFENIDEKRLVKLFSASQKMQNDQFRDVFFSFLKRDLLGNSVHQAQDIPQSQAMITLQQHNENIRKILLENDIDPTVALNYEPCFEFIVSEAPTSSLENEDNQKTPWIVLWNYFRQIDLAISQSLSNNQSQLSGQKNDKILKKIQEYYQSLSKQISSQHSGVTPTSEHIFSTLTRENNKQLLIKANKKITGFLEENPTTSLREFMQHYNQQIILMEENFQHTTTSKKNRNSTNFHYFRALQWKKSDPDTLFLGDYVGCCLATDAPQFPAMIQRRMDDAMLFHVVIDLGTQKPCALIWLYLATTSNNQIVLVANFFEVNAKYGSKKSLRLGILDGLLKFTEQYLKDNPKIKNFYMNKLTYGWNNGDLNAYSTEITTTLNDKVGGGLTLRKNADHLKTTDTYYLVSLKPNTTFHIFSEEILNKSINITCINVREKITASIQEHINQNPNSHSLNSTKDHIIKKYIFQLSYFFKSPLNQNEQLIALIREQYEFCLKSSSLQIYHRNFLCNSWSNANISAPPSDTPNTQSYCNEHRLIKQFRK